LIKVEDVDLNEEDLNDDDNEQVDYIDDRGDALITNVINQ